MDYAPTIFMLSVGLDREIPSLRISLSFVLKYWLLQYEMINIKGIKISDSETKLLQFADDTTAILADLNSAQALLKLLNDFEKVSGLKLNFMKTEAMWIGSLQNCEDEPLGFKWKTRLKKIANLINLWKSRGLSIYGKVSIIKAILPKMIYPSSQPRL